MIPNILARMLLFSLSFAPIPNAPSLPDLAGPDVSGVARIVILLDGREPLVEIDGQLYTLEEDRPFELAFGELDTVTLLFVLPYGASLLVSEEGVWTDELAPTEASTTLAVDLHADLFTSGLAHEVGFEVALPGQGAPTLPDIVIRPSEDDPDPR